MKATLVLLLLGLLAVNSAYGLKCVQCDNCDDNLPEATECTDASKEIPDYLTTQAPSPTPTGPTPTGPTPTGSAPTGPTDSSPTGPTDASPTGPTDASPTGPTDASPTDPSSTDSSSTDSSSVTTPTTSTQTPVPGPPDTRQRRSANKYLRADEVTTKASDDYKCFKYDYEYANGTVTMRGCTKQISCDKLKEKLGENIVKTCSDVCDTEGCNPASNMKSWALSSVILVAIVKMFL